MKNPYLIQYHEDGEGFRLVRLADSMVTAWMSNEEAFDRETGGQFTDEQIWRNYWQRVLAEANAALSG